MKTVKIVSAIINRLFTMQDIDLIRWIIKIWNTILHILNGHSLTGMYEVLQYESTLELLDAKGISAKFNKVEKVRFLQDNIIAYQDQAWGDGKILLGYRCSPGRPVDRYRIGHKTMILVSLRQIQNKGEIGEFRIDWDIKNGFRENEGFWETSIDHLTKEITINVIFPRSRPPIRYQVVEVNRKREFEIKENAITQLPDKRWQLTWRKANPLLHERYLVKWVW